MKASVPKLFGCPGAPLSSSPFPGPQLSGVVRCPHRLLNLQHRRIAPASALGSPSVPLCSSPDLLRAITFRSRMISSPCFQVLLPLNLLHQQDRSRLCPQSFRCSQALAPEQSNNLAHPSLSPSRKQPLETPSSPSTPLLQRGAWACLARERRDPPWTAQDFRRDQPGPSPEQGPAALEPLGERPPSESGDPGDPNPAPQSLQVFAWNGLLGLLKLHGLRRSSQGGRKPGFHGRQADAPRQQLSDLSGRVGRSPGANESTTKKPQLTLRPLERIMVLGSSPGIVMPIRTGPR